MLNLQQKNTKDWNLNVRIDNKDDKELKIKVADEVVYTIDLSKLKLTPQN